MATFTVTTPVDENDAGASVAVPRHGLSLREAIALAGAGRDTIRFGAGLAGTIRLGENLAAWAICGENVR